MLRSSIDLCSMDIFLVRRTANTFLSNRLWSPRGGEANLHGAIPCLNIVLNVNPIWSIDSPELWHVTIGIEDK